MKYHFSSALWVTILFLVTAISCQQEKGDKTGDRSVPKAPRPTPYERYKDKIDALTLKEKIGQTVIIYARPDSIRKNHGSIANFLDRYPVGGVFIGFEAIGLGSDGEKSQDDILSEMRGVISEFVEGSDIPILIQQDFEDGLGVSMDEVYTHLPTEMGLGATHDPKMAYDYGKTVALESASAGYNWMLHPMSDLNTNPLNPVVNIRALTDDADLAVSMLSQQIKALQDRNIAATIKSFPGDGVDSRDQHLIATVNDMSREEWWQNHGKVFQALIDSGVYSTMPVHISLPFYQSEKERYGNGYLPATLSKELITNLLKEDMGFGGVVVSDAMVMAGYRSYFETQMQRQIISFEAGTDMMLWPTNDFMDSLELYVGNGRIPMERLNDAVARVWDMKEKLGLFDEEREIFRPMSEEEKRFCAGFNEKVSAACLTPIRNDGDILPLSPDKHKKVLLVNLAPKENKAGSINRKRLDYTYDLLVEKGFDIDYREDYLFETHEKWEDRISDKYDAMIFMFCATPHRPIGTLMPYDNEAQAVWGINALPKDKIIVVSYGTPYVIPHFMPEVQTAINAYGPSKGVQKAFVDFLVTGKELTGKSPVKLDKVSFR